MAEENTTDIDAVDIASGIGALIGTASAFTATGSLFFGLLYAGAYGLQHWIRRTEFAKRLAQRVTDDYPLLENVAPKVLPGPKEDEERALTIRQDKPLDVRVVNEIIDLDDGKPFWQRMTQRTTSTGEQVLVGTTQRKKPLVSQQEAYLYKSLKRLPKYINYKQLPAPPSRLCVPIGVESVEGHVVWGDFSSDGTLIHALVAGQTGSGKDALLRLWFSTLTVQNTPEELQFVILDGKIDWLSPALAESAYMAIKPAGGIKIEKDKNGKRVNVAQYDMANNLDWIFDEIERRTAKFTACGAVDLAGYRKRTGDQLPYIFVLASDVGGEFNSDLELLVQMLIMRGRSYGVRLIISMQNPVGENTRWRSQIGLIMSGYQQNPDHDRYILGTNVDRMLVRPSQLPNPEESDASKGLFVVRLGSTQHLVRTAHLPEEDWYRYIENILPKKRDIENQNLLNSLLTGDTKTLKTPLHIQEQLQRQEKRQPALTERQIQLIRDLTLQGKNKTEIMQGLGFTNGVIYKQKNQAVEIVINAVKRKYGV